MTHAVPIRQFSETVHPVRSLSIEGWRGINHSFALVNQHQILELLKLDELKLFHSDLPFAFAHWNRTANASGLLPEQQAQIDALGPAGREPVDCVYRIGSPFRAGSEAEQCKTVTFMVTELGLTASSFEAEGTAASFTRHDNRIVTPSRWARERLVEWGFPETKVDVIHHGVDSTVFTPLSPDERQTRRRALGFGDDEIVFMNVGLPTWNKGLDLLLAAFATLRAAGRKVRLILKDQRDLYGCSVEDLIRTVGLSNPALLAADTLGTIAVIPGNLETGDLRTLFAVADCYVSPYRAEGFNLPVLEAVACGTPVIVTRGGATDDFCDDEVAIRIDGVRGRRGDEASGNGLCFIEPRLPDLVDAMAYVAATRSSTTGLSRAQADIVDRFTWRNAALQLANITVDLTISKDKDDVRGE